jgi:hypothetical protein
MCVTLNDIYSRLTIVISWSNLYCLLLYYPKYHIQWLKKQTYLETGKHTDPQDWTPQWGGAHLRSGPQYDQTRPCIL